MKRCADLARFAFAAWLVLVAGAQGQTPSAASPPASTNDRDVSDADSNVGYIDSALMRNTLRLRFDAARDDNRPARAEFFYPKPRALPGGRGPDDFDQFVNYRDYQLYVEVAVPGLPLSGFLETPYRDLHSNDSTEHGIGDMNAGFKWGLIQGSDFSATFQFRTYAPTGDGRLGLGTEHVSVEPALLWNCAALGPVGVEGELRYWAPIGGTDFAGDVLRYGIGVSYVHGDRAAGVWVAPVAEFVGWTVLGGKESTPQGVTLDAAGDTIVNAKVGLRVGWCNQWDVYAGYGHALTGDVWYKDDFRVEFRWFY